MTELNEVTVRVAAAVARENERMRRKVNKARKRADEAEESATRSGARANKVAMEAVAYRRRTDAALADLTRLRGEAASMLALVTQARGYLEAAGAPVEQGWLPALAWLCDRHTKPAPPVVEWECGAPVVDAGGRVFIRRLGAVTGMRGTAVLGWMNVDGRQYPDDWPERPLTRLVPEPDLSKPVINVNVPARATLTDAAIRKAVRCGAIGPDDIARAVSRG